MKRFKHIIGAGAVGLLATAGMVAAAAPAGATIKVGQINCTANIPALTSTVALQQPSTSHVQGPIWSARGAPVNLVTPGSVQILPSSAGGQTVASFRDLKSNSMLAGLNANPTTGVNGAGDTILPTVTNQAQNGYFYDNDVTDANPPVPMDGAGGHPAKPLLTITQGSALIATAGTYFITVSISPDPAALTVSGPVGGAIFSPGLTLGITDIGGSAGVDSIDGAVNLISTSTTLTAKVLGVIDAITTCVPSADPTHTVYVNTDGTLDVGFPAVSCQPTTGTAGLIKDSKGLSTGAAGIGGAYAASTLSLATTYDGCNVPDAQAALWVAAKQGASITDAQAAVKASIAFKGKAYGNCTLVDTLSAAGQAHNNDLPSAYQTFGALSSKYLNAAGKATKVPGSSASSEALIVLDSSDSLTNTAARLEIRGTVTKGLGAGGAAYYLGELDPANVTVQQLLGCNQQAGGVAAPLNTALGSVKAGIPVKTAGDAEFTISAP